VETIKKYQQECTGFFSLFIILVSTLSAFAITSVNGWMNRPTGFDMVDGKFENISVFSAMFSNTSIITFLHSMPAYYLSASLCVAGLYAFKILKSKKKDRLSAKHKMDWFIVRRLVLFATVMIFISGVTADLTGKYLAKYEHVKLAAIELNNETQKNAPLLVGGFPDAKWLPYRAVR
jgi:cytochrome d ubiquinol oxidase subunit I